MVEEPTQKVSRFQDLMSRAFRNENVFRIIILAVVFAVMGVVSRGRTSSLINIRNILWLASVRGIATIAQFFAMRVGGIDLSVGGLAIFVMGMGAVYVSGAESTAGVVTREPLPIALTLLVMIAASTGWGTLNGLLWTRAGIPPLIIGLGMWQVALGLGFLFIGGRVVMGLPTEFALIGQGKFPGAFLPYSIVIFIAILAVVYFVLHHTPFGRAIHAVGGNEVSAYLSGIDVKKVRLQAYMVMGFLMGVASIAILSRSMSTSIWSIPGLEFDTITAIFIGGMSIRGMGGSLIGAIIGLIIVTMIDNAMNLMGLATGEVSVIKGSILAIAVGLAYLRRPKHMD